MGVVMLFVVFGAVFFAVTDKRTGDPAATSTPRDGARVYKENIALFAVGERMYSLEVADTDAKRIAGLSGRANIGEHDGMLFIFPTSARHGIWMKDMHFAIDILWLNGDFRVVHTAARVGPETYPTVFRPARPARFVIELPAGTIDELRIERGDILDLRLSNKFEALRYERFSR